MAMAISLEVIKTLDLWIWREIWPLSLYLVYSLPKAYLSCIPGKPNGENISVYDPGTFQRHQLILKLSNVSATSFVCETRRKFTWLMAQV